VRALSAAQEGIWVIMEQRQWMDGWMDGWIIILFTLPAQASYGLMG
jgi:hypothetical protein